MHTSGRCWFVRCKWHVWGVSIMSDRQLDSIIQFPVALQKGHPGIFSNSQFYLESKREPLESSRLLYSVVFNSYNYRMFRCCMFRFLCTEEISGHTPWRGTGHLTPGNLPQAAHWGTFRTKKRKKIGQMKSRVLQEKRISLFISWKTKGRDVEGKLMTQRGRWMDVLQRMHGIFMCTSMAYYCREWQFHW